MTTRKVIAFFPEAAYGPALNSVGIAQACERHGHQAVFLTAPDMAGRLFAYGFQEFVVKMAPPMAAEEAAQYWQNFINGHIPNFNKSPSSKSITMSATVGMRLWTPQSGRRRIS